MRSRGGASTSAAPPTRAGAGKCCRVHGSDFGVRGRVVCFTGLEVGRTELALRSAVALRRVAVCDRWSDLDTVSRTVSMGGDRGDG